MKKATVLLAALCIFTSFSFFICYAEPIVKDHKQKYEVEIKEIKNVMETNNAGIKKLEKRIDSMEDELRKTFAIIFDKRMPANELQVDILQERQEHIIKNIQQISETDKRLKALYTEANVCIKEKHYEQALENFGDVVDMQERLLEQLNEYSKEILNFTQLINSH